jgi:3-phosphoshikimate 1-carboxyvinyltransferase
LLGGQTSVSGITSQYLSALLLALPCAPQASIVTVQDLVERPYVDLTLQWLRQQQMDYQQHQSARVDVFTIEAQQRYQAFTANMSGDFSSASYLIAAAVLIPGRVEVLALDMHDLQGDKQLVFILQAMGADICIDHDRLIIQGGKALTGIVIDGQDIPDLLPILAVIATQAQGKTDIVNVEHARIKETDRIHSMQEGLQRLNATVVARKDGLTIYPSALHGARLNGYGDHRTVMALTVAALLASGDTIISDVTAINKTYPEFIEHMCLLGAYLEIQ